MRATCLLFVGLAGCVAAPEPLFEMEPPPPEDTARTCEYDHEVALHGMSAEGPTSLGPITVGSSGTRICLDLDGTDNLRVAHFAAGTAREASADSSFDLALYDEHGVLVREGWDVTFGTSSPSTFANLEHVAPIGQVTRMILEVRARGAAATTELSLYLFEPYE
jgi:hypothetical protein